MNRLALVLALVLALAPAVAAQGSTTNATNGTATNATTSGDANATSAPPAPIEITLTGHDEAGAFFWTVDDKTDHNPTLTVEPGQQVTFHVKAATGTHNLKVASEKQTKAFSEGDPVIDFVWTAPTTPGSVAYICTIHAGTMKGTIKVGASAPSPGGGGGAGEITGDTVDLGDIGHPECAGTKIPAIAEKGVTGGPTVDDYAKNCHGGAAAAGKPASGADYVIPVSLVLIGLGVVGVVWVHRAYKP